MSKSLDFIGNVQWPELNTLLLNGNNILKSLFPDGISIPELQKTYEAILGRTFDRRNFRKKIKRKRN